MPERIANNASQRQRVIVLSKPATNAVMPKMFRRKPNTAHSRSAQRHPSCIDAQVNATASGSTK
jgi:hypothetical protein